MAGFTVISDPAAAHDRPQQRDLDRCVHCGLCLNACPTYRVLGVEMDSPRGRIYQMNQAGETGVITEPYREHIDLCLACRACETACPSGVQYGRLIEAARADIESRTERTWPVRLARWFTFRHLLSSPGLLTLAGSALWIYQATGLQKLARALGIFNLMGSLGRLEALAPPAEIPFFWREIGKTYPAEGARKHRVAFLAGCIANISFACLNEATVRVLRRNGCEVAIPAGQTCCGALHAHSGERKEARRLARCNIDALLGGGFDAVISNAAGCGAMLKEYGELLEHDPDYAGKAHEFSKRILDVNEFLASIELNRDMHPVKARVTYQDSCHLAHGQNIKKAPRQLLAQIPGIEFREMPLADLCCGSAGIYNVLQTGMSMKILDEKMRYVNSVDPEIIVTANPGCMLQLQAGVRMSGKRQRVMHVVELLDEAYDKEAKAI